MGNCQITILWTSGGKIEQRILKSCIKLKIILFLIFNGRSNSFFFWQLNTFQIVLVSDGSDTFAILNYLDGGINWITSEGKLGDTNKDPPGQVGFDAGDEKRAFRIGKYSGKSNADEVAT